MFNSSESTKDPYIDGIYTIGKKPKSPVIFYDGQFKTIAVSTSIVRRILESGYGIETGVTISEMYGMHEMFPKNEININLEMWRTHMEDWVIEMVGGGHIVDLGSLYDESGDGFYVPRYIIEGDSSRGIAPTAPDLSSVFDLKRYRQLTSCPKNRQQATLFEPGY